MIFNEIPIIQISQSYLRFNYTFNESNRLRVKEAYIKEVHKPAIERIHHVEDFRVSIEFEEGSIKCRIKVWAPIWMLAISQYGSFRAGLRELQRDAQFFTEYVNTHISDTPTITRFDLITSQQRKALPGRLQEIYDRIDALERKLPDLTHHEIQKNISEVKQSISNLMNILPDDIRDQFLNELPNTYKDNLPPNDQNKTLQLANRYILKPTNNLEFIDEKTQ